MVRLLSIALTAALFAVLLAPSARALDEYSDFRLSFEQAAKLGSKSKMDQLMKRQQTVAIYWIQTTAEQIGAAPTDVLYVRFDALRQSWTRVYATEFPDKMEQFFSYADIATKRERAKLQAKYQKRTKSQAAAQVAKDGPKLTLIADEFTSLADSFMKIGDQWLEAQSCLNLAAALEETWHGKNTDFNRMTNAYARFVKLREDLGVRDRSYREALPRLKGLQGLGFGSDGSAENPGRDTGGGGAVVTSAPLSRGTPVSVKMEYEAFDAIKERSRPNYYLDQHRQVWPTINLGKVGSTAKFSRLKDGPTIIRESASRPVIDTDGDGKGDMVWPTRGKLEAVTFDIGTGASKRTWSVLSEVGRQEDYFQGIQTSLQASDSSFRIFFIPAGSLVGEISGVKIQVVDDNIDGVYGSPPTMWRHLGLTEGVEQPEFDSIRIGGAKRAGPWSEYVNVGKAGWHRLESVDGGTRIKAQPVEFKTGTLQLKAKGLKPDFFIVQGLGTDLGMTYIDVAGGKKIEVPIGRWELAYGMVRKGKKMQEMKAVILSTNSMKAYEVLEGENVVIEIGAPYRFEFDYAVKGDKVIVDGPSVQVLGSAGEAYDRIYGAVPRPEAGVRKKGSKRASASKRMRPVEDNGGIQKHGWKAMWKPLPVEITKKSGDVEVQLVEKKNKLFGSIGSDWK